MLEREVQVGFRYAGFGRGCVDRLDRIRHSALPATENQRGVNAAERKVIAHDVFSVNIAAEHVMSNNFAFGGINTSLIFSRYGS